MSKQKQKQKISVVDILSAKNRQTIGYATEVVELSGNVAQGEDGHGVHIVSMDGYRLANNNQSCRFAFKGEEKIQALNDKAEVRGEGEDAQVLIKVKFKLKRSDDTTYFVSKVFSLDEEDTAEITNGE
jgi:hypothetical protein